MKFEEGTYVAIVWFVPEPEERADWFCTLFKRPSRPGAPDEPWRAEYRFRYYTDQEGRIFDSDDVKNVYETVARDGSPGERGRLASACSKMAAQISHEWNGAQVHKLIIDSSSMEEVLRQMSA